MNKPAIPRQVQDKADEVMSAGRHIARKTTPYFQSLLLKLVPRPVPGLGTVGVSNNAILVYDPFEVAKWTPTEMAGALVHEVMHLWLRHGERVGKRDPREWNIAGDRAINPGIIEMGLKLPMPGGSPCCFPRDIQMQDGLTADEYYQAPKQQGGGSGASQKKGIGHGECGGCAGQPGEGEPDKDDPDGRTEAELERTARQTSEAVASAARDKSQGRVPASWARIAQMDLEPPKVDWRAVLAMLMRQVIAFRPGATIHRYDAPSRRQAGLGFGSGCPVLPRTRTPVPEVAVVADTSGSMGEGELGEVLRETEGILKAVDARVTFCACDASVHGIAPVQSVAQALKLLKGGGGTDFRPAFEALTRFKPRPEVIVFCTDGYGTPPSEPPPGVRVIWLLIGGSTHRPTTWGEYIECK